MGFAECWIHLIMTCVRIVSYSVLINGSPQWRIIPTEGLQQGDPLSPYLFLLCAAGLSSLITAAKREGRIAGLPIVRGGPCLSHLFFANYSLLFCRATFSESCALHGILEIYENASRQKIIKEKTSIFFSRNTGRDFQAHIFSIPGISTTRSYEKYLGLSALVRHKKQQTFAGIMGRVRASLIRWKERFLS